MSDINVHISSTLNLDPPQLTIILTGTETLKEFEEFCDRALNCWEYAPGEFKALGDIVKHGKPLQNYGVGFTRIEKEV